MEMAPSRPGPTGAQGYMGQVHAQVVKTPRVTCLHHTVLFLSSHLWAHGRRFPVTNPCGGSTQTRLVDGSPQYAGTNKNGLLSHYGPIQGGPQGQW